ncbi:MAG: TonB-dependent receptor, partial [Bacteroidaceae bacterium]|nr:TonB-dependent receptor [Bacteroidaceae bacterium]
FFRGSDNMGMDDIMTTSWANTLGNIRYWHAFNDKHEMSTSAFVSSYGFDGEMDITDISNNYGTGIKHVGLKQTFVWTPSNVLTLNYGFQTKYTDLMSLRIFQQNLDRKEQRKAWENDVWVGADITPTDWLAMNVGVRMNVFSALGGAPYYDIDKEGKISQTYNYDCGKFVKTYFTVEPRFTANFKVNKTASIKLGYARTGQNIRPLYNNGMSSTFNRYTMSSNIFKPEVADQVSLGFVKAIKGGAYEVSAEGYFKTLDNVLDYKDGKNFTSEIEVERIVLDGKGRSYGFEVMARKNTGKLTGWVSYTLSWTDNKIDGINNGEWYTASNDRRHDVSIALMYDLTEKWQLSATWVLQSGQALTAPSAKYDIQGETIYYYAERNGYRAPAYHRLDLSATYKRQHQTKKGRKWSSEWVFGVYNAYNRYNPYMITFKNNSTYQSGTKATLVALFGVLPSVSYNFYF